MPSGRDLTTPTAKYRQIRRDLGYAGLTWRTSACSRAASRRMSSGPTNMAVGTRIHILPAVTS